MAGFNSNPGRMRGEKMIYVSVFLIAVFILIIFNEYRLNLNHQIKNQIDDELESDISYDPETGHITINKTRMSGVYYFDGIIKIREKN